MKILLLGSGELGKEFVIAAQRIGQTVIAVDSYENAPAMQVAHGFEVINMLDGCSISLPCQAPGEMPVGSPEDERPVTNKILPRYTPADKTPCGASCSNTLGEILFKGVSRFLID